MRRKSNSAQPFTAVDVFAGGGGLTVGLKKAGFRVVSAVEIETHAFATYKANNPDVHAYKQDVRTISGRDFLLASPTGSVDLLAGCPPCQGFSSLTSKYRRADERNQLVNEMGRLIHETQPRAVMIENVPGLVDKGKPLFQALLEQLDKLGYKATWNILQVADFGIPQNRRRLVLLAGKGFDIHLPKPTHSRSGKNGLPRWKTLRDALGALPTSEAIDILQAHKLGGPERVNWHVTRTLSARNLARLNATAAGASWKDTPESLRPPCHKNLQTGFNNVYGRMAWDQVPVTITGGFTTLSKGRFGHPSENRTLSVREGATIQTFPIDYIFDTPYMEYVCNIIGNALPCDFAEVVARQCAEALSASERSTLQH